MRWFLDRNAPDRSDRQPAPPGVAGLRLLLLLNEDKLRRVLSVLLDENEFLSPHGIRPLPPSRGRALRPRS